MAEVPRINLVVVLKRTIEKVMDAAQLDKAPVTLKLVAGGLINIASVYLRESGASSEDAVALFQAFLTGTPEEQQAASKKFAEEVGKPIEQPKILVPGGDA